MKRNHGIDSLKFISMFMVICIHIQFPEPLRSVITPLTRIAVPIFLMITGYFYSFTVQKGNEKRQIIKIMGLLIRANLLFFSVDMLHFTVTGGSFADYLSTTLNLKNILEFIILNDSPFSGHLWYLGALLYALVIVLLFEKKWNRKYLYPLVPLLLLTDLVFGKYSLAVFGRSFDIVLVRNFLFVGLPYFLIGDMLYKYSPKLKTHILVLLTPIFYLTTLLEHFLPFSGDMSTERYHYVSTTFLAICVFLLALRFGKESKKPWGRKLAFIGSGLSLTVYIIHPLIIPAVNTFISALGNIQNTLSVIGSYAAPFIVMFISVSAAWIFDLLKSKLKKQQTENRLKSA